MTAAWDDDAAVPAPTMAVVRFPAAKAIQWSGSEASARAVVEWAAEFTRLVVVNVDGPAPWLGLYQGKQIVPFYPGWWLVRVGDAYRYGMVVMSDEEFGERFFVPRGMGSEE